MSSTAPTPAELAMYRLWAVWQIKNQNTAKYFGAAIGGLIALFTILHWSEILFRRYCSRPGTIRDLARSIIRPLRRLDGAHPFLRPGRSLLALVYFGIVATLTFYDRPDKAGLTILGKRMGWMALLNVCLAVFLGLKNTPLSPLAGKSFDAVNVLHRCVGYTTVTFMFLHVGTYLPGLAQHHVLMEIMTEPAQIAGGIAGTAMFLILITAIGPIRRRNYEVFYITHILMVATILVAVGLHRPSLALRTLIITLLAATLWFTDRLLRALRWLYFSPSNHCTLTPLPNAATLVTLHRQMRAQPGSSAFLWIPSIRPFESHPFTLVSSTPHASFIIKAHDGFTRALHLTACKHPTHTKFRAALEGPYGNVPNVHDFDKLLLLAGGSGVTFTMSLALEWSRKRRTPNDNSSLEFIWTVKHYSTLSWFAAELSELQANPRVTVILHHTSGSASNSETSSLSGIEKAASDSESEKSFPRTEIPSVAQSGRPDARALVSNSLAGMSPNKSVLIAACGPKGLLNHLRVAVAEVQVWGAPSVKLHLEEFSF